MEMFGTPTPNAPVLPPEKITSVAPYDVTQDYDPYKPPPPPNTTTFQQWLEEDSESVDRRGWLSDAQECVEYAKNNIIFDDGMSVVAKTSYFPRIINTLLGVYLHASIIPQALTEDPRLQQQVVIYSRLLSWKWDSLFSFQSNRLVGLDAIIKGMPIIRVEYDAKAAKPYCPAGDAKISRLNPFNVILDSRAHDETQPRRMSIIYFMPKDVAERRWGKRLPDSPSYRGNWFQQQPILNMTNRDPYRKLIPVVETLYCESEDYPYLYPTIEDVYALANAGFYTKPGTLIDFKNIPPEMIASGYQFTGLTIHSDKDCWYGSYNYGEIVLQEPCKTFTGNCPVIVGVTNPRPDSPLGDGILHDARGVQFILTIFDTIMARLKMDSQARKRFWDSNIFETPDASNAFAEFLSEENVTKMAQGFPLSPEYKGQNINNLIGRDDPNPTLVDSEARKVLSDMLGVITGITDYTVGMFPASDSGSKSQLRQQAGVPQIDTFFMGLQNLLQRAFIELGEIIKLTHTGEFGIPSGRGGYGRGGQIVVINRILSIDQANEQVEKQQATMGAPLVRDEYDNFIQNSIQQLQGMEIKVHVDTQTNADKMAQVESNALLNQKGYLPERFVLQPHPNPAINQQAEELPKETFKEQSEKAIAKAEVQSQVLRLTTPAPQNAPGTIQPANNA